MKKSNAKSNDYTLKLNALTEKSDKTRAKLENLEERVNKNEEIYATSDMHYNLEQRFDQFSEIEHID